MVQNHPFSKSRLKYLKIWPRVTLASETYFTVNICKTMRFHSTIVPVIELLACHSVTGLGPLSNLSKA